jgi:hypothetical protein
VTDNAPRVLADEELIELFGDDAEALAILDAIQATQPVELSHARRRRTRALVLGAAAAVAAAVALIVGQPSRAGVIDHALAAFPVDRVIHLTLVYADSSQAIIDLKTGRSAPVQHRFDEWYDARTEIRRFQDTVAGVPITDIRVRGRGEVDFYGLALTRLPTIYRRALSHASEKDVRPGRIGDRAVFWIELDSASVIRVAVDRRTYRPLVVVLRGADGPRRLGVTGFDTTRSRVPAAKAVPRLESPPVVKVREVPPAKGSLAYRTFGADFDGLRRTVANSVAIGSSTGYNILFTGGARQRVGRFLQVEESQSPAPAFGWTVERATLAPLGSALLQRQGTFDVVFVRIGGRAFHVVAPSKSGLALKAVRRLAAGST